jgi:hypothetical protein
VAAVVLFTVLAFMLGRRLRRGAAFLLWFIAVSAGLTALQATCRSRFLHSWIAATWVTAGVGLALCIYGWRPGSVGRLRHVVAGLALGVVLLRAAPNAFGPGHAFEGGPEPQRACILPVAKELLPRLDGARRVAIVSTHSLTFFASWTDQERSRQTERVIGAVYQLPADPAEFAAWAERTRCDAIVWIDAAPASPLYLPSLDPQDARVPALMARQTEFVASERCDWPELGCWATIWRRTPSVAKKRSSVGQAMVDAAW